MKPTSARASATSQRSGGLAAAAATLALTALAVLHVLRPDLDPARTMISEYAIGPYGWVMTLCFAAFAASTATLVVALGPDVRSRSGRIGLGFLLFAVVGLSLGGAFATDASSIPRQDPSFSAAMHSVGFMIGVPSQLVGVLLVSLALRQQQRWSAVALLTMAVAVWISLLAMAAALSGATERLGVDGLAIFGWPNRMLMVAYGIWLIAAAWPTRHPIR